MAEAPRPAGRGGAAGPGGRRAAFNSQLTTSSSSGPAPSRQPSNHNHASSNATSKGKGKESATPFASPGLTKPAANGNAKTAAIEKNKQKEEEVDESTICFICAEEVTYWAVGECGHRTCHTCAIRLRALYKNLHCTFCKTECPRVIFTSSPSLPFSAYPLSSTPFSDTKLGILFETREQMDDSLSLLRFNCPFSSCDAILSGWDDLKRHVKAEHKVSLCALCATYKKIFAHEHALYTAKELTMHTNKDHAVCGFDRMMFYDSDGLYAHCRDRHEECFICVRQGIRHQYHYDYPRLEEHYKSEHFLCPHPNCLAQKFVVFESEIDLQAHSVEVHGAAFAGDQRARKDARRIETNFTYEGDGGGRGRGGAGRGGRGGGVVGMPTRQERFGASLTPGAHDLPPHQQQQQSRPQTPVGPPSTASPDAIEKHAALLRQVAEAVGSEAKVTSFKLAVRSYRGSEMSAGDLVDNIWNILDQDVDVMNKIVTGLAELFDDADKKRRLLSSWQDLRVEQNSFPSLAPIGPALNGIPTAAHNTSQRALNNRNVRNQRDPAVWARVENAASASRGGPAPRERFPALPTSAKSRQGGVRATPWAGTSSVPPSSSSSVVPSRSSTPAASFVAPGPSSTTSRTAVRTGVADFPSLPTSDAEMERRARVRAALGPPAPTIADPFPSEGANVWGSGEASGNSTRSASPEPSAQVAAKTGKKQKKQKVLLMSHGIQRG